MGNQLISILKKCSFLGKNEAQEAINLKFIFLYLLDNQYNWF